LRRVPGGRWEATVTGVSVEDGVELIAIFLLGVSGYAETGGEGR
jgi:hypothetical protein